MAADESALGKLHLALAKVLAEALVGQTTEGYIDPDTEEFVEGTVIPPSAAIMTVAAKFLKDNSVTCEPSKDNDLGRLQDIMTERQRKLRGLDKTDLAGIQADAGFMGHA